MAANPAFVGTPKMGVVQIVNADGTNSKTVCTAGASGSKITGLMGCSDDTSARIFKISVTRSATNYIIGTVSIAAASGTDGSTAAVDMLNSSGLPGIPVDTDGNPYLFLESGDTLTVALTTSAVTAAKTVHVTAVYGNF